MPMEGEATSYLAYDESAVTVEEVSIEGGTRRTITSDDAAKANLAVRINKGRSIVAVSGLLSDSEVADLARWSLEAADRQTARDDGAVKTTTTAAGNGGRLDRVCVRMPTVAASERGDVPDAGAHDLHDPLPNEASRFAEERILRRAMEYVDRELGDVSRTLFGCWNADESLERLFSEGRLEWSTREPAANVYYPPDGHFGIHKDSKALTILMPLTSRGEDFTGGGTAFWSQSHPDERRHAPSLVLAPDAGTALLFGGKVSHKGLRIETGRRVVFVASFSRKPAGEKSKTWVVSAR